LGWADIRETGTGGGIAVRQSDVLTRISLDALITLIVAGEFVCFFGAGFAGIHVGGKEVIGFSAMPLLSIAL